MYTPAQQTFNLQKIQMTTDISPAELDQYFTFKLDNEYFALDIAAIREVLELPVITRIPGTPKFMRGVINLRGNAVPVVDLRRKFTMSDTEPTVETCIIIIEVTLEEEPTLLGALVDSVSEVVNMPPSSIEPAPRMGTAIKSEFIKGISPNDGNFVIILDIDRVFSMDELAVQPTSVVKAD